MRITSKLVLQWDEGGEHWVEIERVSNWHNGPVALCCGATGGQKDIANQQSSFSQQLVNQATQVFGAASQVFSNLMNTFAPIVKAGINQRGFSAGESASLKSAAITNTGQAYKNAKAAVGNAEAAQGGGNTGLVSGSRIGTDMGLAESGANQTASELNQIDQADYATGRQNYLAAVSGMEQAPNVFNSATGAAEVASNQQKNTADTQNQIAQQDNSWVQAVTGALGGIAGDVVTGGMKNLGSGVGFFGGGKSSNG